MLPASHALTGYLAARFLRWRVGPEHDPSPWRPDPLIVIAVAGTLFPDWDLLPSFLLDCEWPVRCRDWPDFHRGPTHSVVGAVLQAPLLAAPFRYAWRWLFGSAPPMKLLTVAALLGLLSHVFWDLLNPWGVELYWPFSSRAVSGLLLHGQDLFVLAVLLLCSLLVWRAKFTAGFLAAVLLLPGYLLFQLNFRERATQVVVRQFPAAAIRPYPNPRLGCPWLVGVELEGAIEGHCLSRPWDTETRLALSVPLDSHPAIEATLQLWKWRTSSPSEPLRSRKSTPRMTGSSWSSGGTCAKPCWRSALRSRQGFMFGSTRRERSWSTAKSGSCDRCCDLGSFPGSHP